MFKVSVNRNLLLERARLQENTQLSPPEIRFFHDYGALDFKNPDLTQASPEELQKAMSVLQQWKARGSGPWVNDLMNKIQSVAKAK